MGEAARLAGEAQVEASRRAAEAQAVLDNAISATMSAYFRAKDAGVAAYDRVFEAAIASGANQEAGHRERDKGCSNVQSRRKSAARGTKEVSCATRQRLRPFLRLSEVWKLGRGRQGWERKAARETFVTAWKTAIDAIGTADTRAC